MSKFVRCYEEFTDSSAFEHFNPDNIFRVYIDREDEEGCPIVTVVSITDQVVEIPFHDYKEAHRAIKRFGGVV